MQYYGYQHELKCYFVCCIYFDTSLDRCFIVQSTEQMVGLPRWGRGDVFFTLLCFLPTQPIKTHSTLITIIFLVRGYSGYPTRDQRANIFARKKKMEEEKKLNIYTSIITIPPCTSIRGVVGFRHCVPHFWFVPAPHPPPPLP